MRVAILGAGGLGRALVAELRTDPRVSALVLVDRLGDRAKVLAAMRGRVPMEAHTLAVEDHDRLQRAIRGCDVVVNATLPRYNLLLMGACLEAGADYLDVSATGPRSPGGPPGIYEQLELHDTFRQAGITALISMGLDPGISNVLAREAADSLDRIDAIRIRSASRARLPGFEAFPLYSREAFLSDILVRPTVWLHGRLEEREPASEEEVYPFPPPLGPLRSYLASHEEVKTLPRFLGKPVGRVDFKHALDPNLVHATLALDRLGLLDDRRTVRVGSQLVPFRQVLLAAFPEPSSLVRPLEGAEALSVEVEGEVRGRRKVLRRDVVMTHAEANRRRGTHAVYYLTASAAAIGVDLLNDKALPSPGVYPSEALDPAAVLREWESRVAPVARSERDAPA